MLSVPVCPARACVRPGGEPAAPPAYTRRGFLWFIRIPSAVQQHFQTPVAEPSAFRCKLFQPTSHRRFVRPPKAIPERAMRLPRRNHEFVGARAVCEKVEAIVVGRFAALSASNVSVR